ncbi:tRNA (N6-threonylcarbamoyladenosine(37)-N6)-methyltransferase TrmO [Nitratireductor mangrovi]|uniref:tRNA (N6-threonylcarbamoyladenosine(37)-N6)-methyltransferase TrmO n=1 Tax=Nitratireductor mangrovi TaxID=2599600 RepID=A0A5B8KUU8_9HYPH|nr:tRNA (N6-threonylcarbamoyladenosine(37)-N6)-methyltransferase TrmO [Nitratireductor mangrovi]QDY99337.1 tRNA (N6-threonylcarbamoyladenosine(37)-N6)-methyltransferase TrmO [Nitratireductor mangrovi]
MKRPGEQALPFDPGEMVPDAHVVFIGRVRSPWTERADCPRNMAAARERGGSAVVEIDAAYRTGLAGLDEFSHVAVLTWLDRSPRKLILQKPAHVDVPRGVFALRSPARPNPVGLHVARILGLDQESGAITIDAIDVLDKTPVIDLKPYFASIDAFPEATGRKDTQKT